MPLQEHQSLILALHAAATWAMVGLIWFVQVVHYPLVLGDLAAELGASSRRLQREHMRRTTVVVAPLMAAEALGAAWIAVNSTTPETIAALALLGVCWVSTALLQVPAHQRLEQAFNPSVARRLVSTNWIRTAAWTLRGALALWILFEGELG